MLKKMVIGFLIVIVILGGAAYHLWSNIDSIVKAAIEKYGTAAIQTEVNLDSAKISISTGEGTLSGLSISNPKGFTAPKAFYMGSISVALDTSSVAGEGPIVIREIVIEKPQVTFEFNAEGKNNLQTIEHNAMGNAGASRKNNNSAGSGGDDTAGSKKQARKIIINDLYIRDGQIAINQPLRPDKAINASLPEIHLTNIGKETGGATPAQIAQQVLGSIAASATKVASSDIGRKLGDSLKDAATSKGVGNLGGQLKGLLGR